METSLSTEKKEELRKSAQALKPMAQIGKSGMTDEVIAEVKKHLKKKKLIKVKLLKTFVQDQSKDELFDKLQEITGAFIVQKVGFMIVLYKP